MKRRLAFVLFLLVGLMFSSPSWNGQAETGIIFAPDQQPDRGTPPPLFFERKVATPDEARDYAAPAATPGEEAQPEEQEQREEEPGESKNHAERHARRKAERRGETK